MVPSNPQLVGLLQASATALLLLTISPIAQATELPLTSEKNARINFTLIAREGAFEFPILGGMQEVSLDGFAVVTPGVFTIEVTSIDLSLATPPLTFTGSFGVNTIPFQLTFDAFGLESPFGGNPPFRVPYGPSGDPTFDGNAVSFILPTSGKLTVGLGSIPFVFDSQNMLTNCAASIPGFCLRSGPSFDAGLDHLIISDLFTAAGRNDGFNLELGSLDGISYSLRGLALSADGLTFGTVPEPSTALLLASGLFCLAMTRRWHAAH